MTGTITAFLLAVSLSLTLSCTIGPTDCDDPAPNILWILLEDTAPLLGAYGTTIIATPNIDELAETGVRFTNVFMPAPTYMDVDGVEFVRVMRQLHAENKLNAAQSRFFSNERPAEELYDLENDPYELNNLAGDADYVGVRQEYAAILDNWIEETDDKGQYPEDVENLKLMLGIWGEHATNPEYEPLRRKHEGLAGSQFGLKNQGWRPVVQLRE